jgi:hypothetical protein
MISAAALRRRGMMTTELALLAMGFLTVCLAMIVLGWTLDMVWVAGKRVGASVEARSGDKGRIARIGGRPKPPRPCASPLSGTSSGGS